MASSIDKVRPYPGQGRPKTCACWSTLRRPLRAASNCRSRFSVLIRRASEASNCAIRSSTIYCRTSALSGSCLRSIGTRKHYRPKCSLAPAGNGRNFNVYAAAAMLLRYCFRRFAWLRSIPESSAPNSAAVISRRFSAKSPNSIA
jgi:hypothetical protein